jgi:hypothetical protein
LGPELQKKAKEEAQNEEKIRGLKKEIEKISEKIESKKAKYLKYSQALVSIVEQQVLALQVLTPRLTPLCSAVQSKFELHAEPINGDVHTHHRNWAAHEPHRVPKLSRSGDGGRGQECVADKSKPFQH